MSHVGQRDKKLISAVLYFGTVNKVESKFGAKRTTEPGECGVICGGTQSRAHGAGIDIVRQGEKSQSSSTTKLFPVHISVEAKWKETWGKSRLHSHLRLSSSFSGPMSNLELGCATSRPLRRFIGVEAE